MKCTSLSSPPRFAEAPRFVLFRDISRILTGFDTETEAQDAADKLLTGYGFIDQVTVDPKVLARALLIAKALKDADSQLLFRVLQQLDVLCGFRILGPWEPIEEHHRKLVRRHHRGGIGADVTRLPRPTEESPIRYQGWTTSMQEQFETSEEAQEAVDARLRTQGYVLLGDDDA